MKIDWRFAALLATTCFGQTAVFSPASILQTLPSNGTAVTTPTASVEVGIAGNGNITLSTSTQSGSYWRLCSMKRTGIAMIAAVTGVLVVMGGWAIGAQDKYTVKVENGLA